MDRRSHYIAIAAAVLIGSPAIAQQPQAQPQLAETSAKPPLIEPDEAKELVSKASVQLAERSDADDPAVPKRRRAARVTTCRCGDPSAQ